MCPVVGSPETPSGTISPLFVVEAKQAKREDVALVIAGSSPADHPSFGTVAHLGERLSGRQEVAGPIPAGSTRELYR